MENVLGMLPFLALLACPVMMAACFFSMRRMGGETDPAAEVQAGSQLPEKRIAVLQQQLQEIQAELAVLQGREGHAPAAACGGEAYQPVDSDPRTVLAG